MRHALLALAAVALVACQPQDPEGAPAPTPADAPDLTGVPQTTPPPPGTSEFNNFAGDIDARGTEPFWNLQIRAGTIILTRPDPEPAITTPNPGVQETGGEAVWSTSHEGKPFIVTLVNEGSCSDGMSDLVYPYVAVVTLGDLTFRGCAYKASAAPKEGVG